jgi:voltage-gated potassium channel
MQRHNQVIFEALLFVLIIIDLLLMGLTVIGFTVGIMRPTVYNFAYFDLIIAILILIDFIFFRIKNKERNKNNWLCLRENWAYIISIIPLTFICFNIFQLFGHISIIGLIGIFRAYALIKVALIVGRDVRKYPSKTKLDTATFVLLLVLLIGSYLFFVVERGVNPEVPNYEAAIWYSFVSMATVGYGDIVPITLIGRIIGVVIILTGMGYVSLVTATLAYFFIDIFRKQSRKASERVEKKLTTYEEKMDELITKIDKLEKKIDENNKEKK